MPSETDISHFIEQQFPAIYREEGPFFVEFVKQYYVWLETDETSPVYNARKHLENRDVDTTVDDFIVYFKEKYLKNIQLNTTTNTALLVKNALDIYRSKGSENAIKLFFELIFSTEAEVYYPGKDVFRLSDARWVIPKYIEITATPINRLLVGRQIRGLTSGATAFVEKLVRRRAKNVYVEVFYLSSVKGSFSTGEIIVLNSNTDTYYIDQYPVMVGSLSTLQIQDGGTGFTVGDIVTLESTSGSEGRAVVQELESVTGIVNFSLEDGGWGYTANSLVLVSNNVLQLSNVTITSSDNTSLADSLTTFTQPMANVQWYDNTAAFSVGDVVYNYEADDTLRGISTIISAEYGNTTTSYFLLNTTYGNSAPYTPMVYTYYSAGNTKSFDVYNGGWADNTATGEFNGLSSNVTIHCSSSNTSSFTNGEFVYQISSNNSVFARGQVIGVGNVTTNTFTIKVNDIDGLWLTNFPLRGETGNGSANISSLSLDIGLIDITGSFSSLSGNRIFENNNNANVAGTILFSPSGSGANAGISANLSYTETVDVNTNYVRDHLEDEAENYLDATSYGALLNNANSSTIIADALEYESLELGSIESLSGISPGSDYSYAPFVRIVEPLIAPLKKADFVIQLSSSTGVFRVGELVTQDTNGAQGLIKSANSSVVKVRRLSYQDRWVVTTNEPSLIYGESTGFTANASSISSDIDGYAGQNAVVSTRVNSSNSSVLSLKVTNSGFNFKDSQNVTFTSEDGENSGQAIANVASHGTGSGYFTSTSGFLSSNKYLYDGEYYQDFSYEIRSPITIDNYSDMLKRVLHVSGTKAFSAIVKKSVIEAQASIVSSTYEDNT